MKRFTMFVSAGLTALALTVSGALVTGTSSSAEASSYEPPPRVDVCLLPGTPYQRTLNIIEPVAVRLVGFGIASEGACAPV